MNEPEEYWHWHPLEKPAPDARSWAESVMCKDPECEALGLEDLQGVPRPQTLR